MKAIIVLVTLFFLTVGINAQSLLLLNNNSTSLNQRPARKGGLLKIGIGISQFNTADNSPKVRFHAGLAPTFPISDEFYIKPEIALSLKGSNNVYHGNYFDGDVTYRLGYLEFPIVVGFKPAEKIAFEFGGYGAFLLESNFDFDGTFLSGYGTFGQGELNTTDYGMVGGLVLSGRRVKIGLRYYYGFQEVASSATARTFLGTATNQTIQLYLQRRTIRERFRESK